MLSFRNLPFGLEGPAKVKLTVQFDVLTLKQSF